MSNQPQATGDAPRPAALDALLGHVSAELTTSRYAAIRPDSTPPAPAAPDRCPLDHLTEAFRLLDYPEHLAHLNAAAVLADHARQLAADIDALGRARGWSTWAAVFIHPDRMFIDTGTAPGSAHGQPSPRR
ncbi:hypothetical protein ACIQXD_29495 [Streptomyces uncialis]|uniref:hypothetical protein n=1 Tax=Streptomyces uncialis TaxID=1048205 RepID=UPI003818C473